MLRLIGAKFAYSLLFCLITFMFWVYSLFCFLLMSKTSLFKKSRGKSYTVMSVLMSVLGTFCMLHVSTSSLIPLHYSLQLCSKTPSHNVILFSWCWNKVTKNEDRIASVTQPMSLCLLHFGLMIQSPVLGIGYFLVALISFLRLWR